MERLVRKLRARMSSSGFWSAFVTKSRVCSAEDAPQGLRGMGFDHGGAWPFRWPAPRRRLHRRPAFRSPRSSATRTARRPPPSRGRAASANPVAGGPVPPRNPFMAPNPRNNIHDDPYMSDTYPQSGPLGDGPAISTLFTRECGSVTFDSAGRIVTVCVGLDRPVLALLDPHTSRRSRPCLCRFGTRRPRAAPSPTSRAAATSTSISTTGQSSRPTTTTSSSSRSRRSRLPGRRRLRPEQGGALRMTGSSRCCRTGGDGSGSSPGRARWERSIAADGSVRTLQARRGRGSRTPSPWTRREECSSSPTRRSTASTPIPRARRRSAGGSSIRTRASTSPARATQARAPLRR